MTQPQNETAVDTDAVRLDGRNRLPIAGLLPVLPVPLGFELLQGRGCRAFKTYQYLGAAAFAHQVQ